ncbi:MAG: nucleoside 2-deoxyribosyltransferase domain-containing protein [Terriglobia bacterium]
MIEIKAPNAFADAPRPWVFLCGSIEMGAAENWQQRLVRSCGEVPGTILNPRRDDWDSSWEQSSDNPQFFNQVVWELQAQELADLILVYFDPSTKSPITLLELGLFRYRPMTVCCPKGFWRKGNVDIVCARYGIRQVQTIEDMADYVSCFLSAGLAARP